MGNYSATPNGSGGFHLFPIPSGIGLGGMIVILMVLWPLALLYALFSLLSFGISRITGLHGKGYAIVWSIISSVLSLGLILWYVTYANVRVQDWYIFFCLFGPLIMPISFIASYTSWSR